MHICGVIGQSNSILSYGFGSLLDRDPRVKILRSGRIGASPSLIMPYFGTRDFFRGMDFCIFDPCIIDQGYFWDGAIDQVSIIKWIETAIRNALLEGCHPILLMIPHRAGVSTTTTTGVIPAFFSTALPRDRGGQSLQLPRHV